MSDLRSKVNPRWEAANFEYRLIWDPRAQPPFVNPYPYRAESVEDCHAGKWVPPFLTEQEDGSWVESW